MPNPFYQCYAGAAVAAGAEPVYLPATRETGFFPDFNAVPPALLERTAAVYLCSPSNPQGTCATRAAWADLILRARAHDFVVLADECYAEIYTGAPPPGVLEAAAATGSLGQVLAFHSLSKRSNLPGLRSGFVAGDPELIARFAHLRNYGGAALPGPIQAASAAAWAEESHVEENRARYRTKFALAEQILGNRFGFYKPGGGFYLWLDVGDGERAALKLWREAGLRVLPGRYLGHDEREGDPASNPGHPYIRIALVADEPTTETALRRLAACL
jgi:aspartate/methionine/tyrosine aminotransferase